MTPIIWLRRWTRLRATALGWKPCWAIAASTAARVSGDTSGRLLMTRETVCTETPVIAGDLLDRHPVLTRHGWRFLGRLRSGARGVPGR